MTRRSLLPGPRTALVAVLCGLFTTAMGEEIHAAPFAYVMGHDYLRGQAEKSRPKAASTPAARPAATSPKRGRCKEGDYGCEVEVLNGLPFNNKTKRFVIAEN